MDYPGEYQDQLRLLRERMLTQGLGRVADAVLAASRPSIWLRLEHKPALDPITAALQTLPWDPQDIVAKYNQIRPALLVDNLPVGQSKLGGLPDLPANVVWPEWNGEPMTFIAQIRLDEAAPFDAEGLLPHAGLLSLFFVTNGEPKGNPADYDPATWRVLHISDVDALHRNEAPPNIGDRHRFLPTRVTFDRKPTLPDIDDPEIVALNLTRDERGAFLNVATDLDLPVAPLWSHVGGQDSHLLGYPSNLGSHALLKSEFASRGQLDLLGTLDPLTKQSLISQANGRWQLLLQVDSNEEASMDWAGGGLLHFCIPKADLRQGDFSRVWVTLQFL